jgi:hypothetical protein
MDFTPKNVLIGRARIFAHAPAIFDLNRLTRAGFSFRFVQYHADLLVWADFDGTLLDALPNWIGARPLSSLLDDASWEVLNTKG